MERILRCECGYEVNGSEAEVVSAAQAHAWESHGMELSPELARALSCPQEAVGTPTEGGDDGVA